MIQVGQNVKTCLIWDFNKIGPFRKYYIWPKYITNQMHLIFGKYEAEKTMVIL